MRTLAFDGHTGAAGDMILGALLAAGADRSVLGLVEDSLPIQYEVEQVDRNGIHATKVNVVVSGAARGDGRDRDGESSHHLDNGVDDEHVDDDYDGHPNDCEEPSHAEGHGVSRTISEVVEIVDGMGLPENVSEASIETFRLLAEAEALVHGTDPEETHFHEVGADDAIADIVGSHLLLDDLAPDRVVTMPVHAGGGEVSIHHGTYVVPVPAVVHLATKADWELRGGPVDAELLTPTGAAILARIAEGIDSLPPMRVSASGYGAGTLDLGDRPNVLRATVGDRQGTLVRDDVRILETNLDDTSSEILGSLQRSLSDAGARDVSVLPATMKKSRPGHVVKVVVKPRDVQQVARRLAEETGTLGIREVSATHRWVANRRFETATLDINGEQYDVRVKVASDDEGEVYDLSAEFDDVDTVAADTGRATRELMSLAENEVRNRLE